MTTTSAIARACVATIVLAMAAASTACSNAPSETRSDPSPVSVEAVRTVLARDPTPAQLDRAQSLRRELRAASHRSQTRHQTGALDHGAFRGELMDHWNEYVSGLQQTLGCSREQALAVLAGSRRPVGARTVGK